MGNTGAQKQRCGAAWPSGPPARLSTVRLQLLFTTAAALLLLCCAAASWQQQLPDSRASSFSSAGPLLVTFTWVWAGIDLQQQQHDANHRHWLVQCFTGASTALQQAATAIPAWVQVAALAITAAWLAAELAFYFCWYLPAYRRWNTRCNAHKSSAAQSTDECYALFRRFMAFSRSQPCQLEFLQQYLSTWFRGAAPDEIKRGNMEELFAYGFFYRTRAELEALGLGHLPNEMISEFEGVFDMKFPPGYNANLKFMSHLWDELRCSWRPLAFYAVMEGLAMLAAAALWAMGFKKRQLGDLHYYTRGIDDTDSSSSSSSDSDSKPQPIVFIHGVAGLLLYLPLLGRLSSCKAPLLLLDMKHVGLRISPTIPTVDELASSLAAALQRHKLPPALLVAHSYGTLVAGRLLRLQRSAVARVLFVDPVCFGMFMPRLLHGFIYAPLRVHLARPLHSGFNLMLWLVSKDIHLAATFARKFYWTDLNLWPEDLPEGSSVVLSGADALVSAADIHKMLSSSGVQVVYKPDLIHGGFMLDNTTRSEVLESVHTMATAAVCAVTAAAATATVAAGAAAVAAPCAAAAAAVTAAAGAAAGAVTNLSSSDDDPESQQQQQQQWQQPDLRRRSFCSSSFSSSRLPAVQEWDVAHIHSSLSTSSATNCSSAAGVRRSCAVDQASKQLRERLAKQCAHLGLEVDARGFISAGSSWRSSSSSSGVAAAEGAAGVAAAAAAATVAAAAATAARTALIAAAASPGGFLNAYSPEVAEWQQQQQPLAVERRNTVH